jgi:hypothetical protein
MTTRRPCPPAPGPLEDYAKRFDPLLASVAQRRGLRGYLQGLLLPRDRNPYAERQGALALGEVVVADAVGAVGGDAEAGVEPLEGLLGGPLGRPVVVVVDPVAMVQLVGQIGVVVKPGADLGMVGGQVGDGMRVGDGVRVGPIVGVELAGLGGQLMIV